MPLLKFSPANAKTAKLVGIPELSKYLAGGNRVYSFDLPAGFSCPGAHLCFSRAVMQPNGSLRIVDGKDTLFRCFAASQEVLYTNTYRLRQHNLSLLKWLHTNDMIRAIDRSIPKDCGILRLHVSGDFFSPAYLFAWLEIARKYKYILFYTYTKSIPFWIKYRGRIPENFILTASYGGRHDKLIRQHRLRCARVVLSDKEARQRNLPIDHDDSHAATRSGGSFALLIHGIQPKGSKAGSAARALGGIGSYQRNK